MPLPTSSIAVHPLMAFWARNHFRWQIVPGTTLHSRALLDYAFTNDPLIFRMLAAWLMAKYRPWIFQGHRALGSINKNRWKVCDKRKHNETRKETPFWFSFDRKALFHGVFLFLLKNLNSVRTIRRLSRSKFSQGSAPPQQLRPSSKRWCAHPDVAPHTSRSQPAWPVGLRPEGERPVGMDGSFPVLEDCSLSKITPRHHGHLQFCRFSRQFQK